MIPLALGCIIGGCLDVPININNRGPFEQAVEQLRRQNPGSPTNLSCYIEGEFYVSCPEEDETDW